MRMLIPMLLSLGGVLLTLLTGCSDEPENPSPSETPSPTETPDPTDCPFWAPDVDGDGYGDAQSTPVQSCTTIEGA
ncbi:MAG: hypothetical protein ACKO6N_20160, partial [Myxococcota bacterium]